MKLKKIFATMMLVFIATMLFGMNYKVRAEEVDFSGPFYWDESKTYVDGNGNEFEYAHLFYDEEHKKPISDWCIILFARKITEKIVIPDYIDGYKVAVLGNTYFDFNEDFEFRDNNRIKEFVMPDTVEYIVSMAGIYADDKMVISKNLKGIGGGHVVCLGENIKSIELPESLKYIYGSGIDCKGNEMITIKSKDVELDPGCICIHSENTNITIKCYRGSTAEKYAKENGFKIQYIKTSIKNAEISVAKECSYKGKTIKPKVTVTLESKKLVEGTDYKITYKNNKNCGTAKLVVKGIGDYEGSVEKTFVIKPAKAKISNISSKASKMTVTWKKSAGGVSGYELMVSNDKKFSKGTVSKTIIKKAKTTKQVISKCAKKKLVAKKTYYAKIRAYKLINGKKVYGEYSKVLKVKIKK